MDEWAKTYDALIKNPPVAGTIIKSLDGKPILIRVDLVKGKTPCMYGLAYVPQIVGCALGWFARSVDDRTLNGQKLILLPRAREIVIKTFGISSKQVPIYSLRIVRTSQSGKSLLVEIASLRRERNVSESETSN